MKYYLAFLFTPDVVALHCTHCYFGTLTADEATFVITMVDNFFNGRGPVKMKTVPFTVPALFGSDNSIRVLLAPDRDAFYVMQPLRTFFTENEMIESGGPYRPHVTTEKLISLNMRFKAYALIGDVEVIKTWPIYETSN